MACAIVLGLDGSNDRGRGFTDEASLQLAVWSLAPPRRPFMPHHVAIKIPGSGFVGRTIEPRRRAREHLAPVLGDADGVLELRR